MHGISGQAFHWTSTGVGGLAFLIVVWLVLMLTNKAPSIDVVRQFADIMSDRGGVIIALTVISLFFFEQSMRLFYVLIDLISSKQLDQQNAIGLMAIQFCSSSAFGLSFGALLKTMNGTTPPPPGATIQSTRTSTDSTTVLDTEKPQS